MSAVAMSDLDKDEKNDSAVLQVTEEEQKLNPDPESPRHSSPPPKFDLKDRDPHRMNQHVKVRFDEIFAEPETEIYSFDKVWRLSFKLFTLTKVWVYRAVTIVLGIPLAIIWGFTFAMLAFCNNWCCMPGLKCCAIELFPVQRIWETCLHTIVSPSCEAIGLLFSRIRLAWRKE